MYINGALVKLVAPPANQGDIYSRLGDQFSETDQFENISIRFDNTVTVACTVENEICEVVSFDTSMYQRDVESRIERLQSLHAELERMISECSAKRVAECRVIEVLSDHNLCLHRGHD